MDALYSAIHIAANWDDEDFADLYPLVKGSLLASTIPLSALALESLL